MFDFPISSIATLEYLKYCAFFILKSDFFVGETHCDAQNKPIDRVYSCLCFHGSLLLGLEYIMWYKELIMGLPHARPHLLSYHSVITKVCIDLYFIMTEGNSHFLIKTVFGLKLES